MKPKKTWTAQEREMLFRKNDGKIRREAYLQKLSHFFATPVQADDLLALEQTDAIMKKERVVLQQQRWICSNRSEVLALYPGWGYRSKTQMLRFAQTLLQQQTSYLYWYGESHCGGLYQTRIGTQINLNYDFAQHKPDDIWLFAADGRFGLHLEYLNDEVLFDEANQRHICVRLLECTYTIYTP